MKKEINLTIRFSKEEIERIEKVAKKLNMPKSRLIRNLTMAGLEDAELYNKLGLYVISDLIKNFKLKVKKQYGYII